MVTMVAPRLTPAGSAIWTQLIKEVEFVAAGLVVGDAVLAAGLRRLAYPVLAVAVAALVAVLVPGGWRAGQRRAPVDRSPSLAREADRAHTDQLALHGNTGERQRRSA